MNAAWVPLPAPGPPSKISRMQTPPRVVFFGARRLYGAGEPLPDAREVLGGVHARFHRLVPEGDGDPIAVAERAQLLQRLEALRRGVREARVAPQESDAVRVEPDVAKGWEAFGQGVPRAREGIAGERDRGAGEILRVALGIDDDLDDIRVEELRGAPQRMHRGCDGRLRPER